MGKRGGVRIIYYVITASSKLYLLIIYPKNAKDDLTESENTALKALKNKLN